MLFNSFTFIFVFLPLLLVLYYSLPSKCKNIILLIFSLIFYAWGSVRNLIFIIISLLINYIFSLFLKRKNKFILIISILFNVIFLFLFKFDISIFGISKPIGISFYTFQIISYLVDLYRKKVKIEKNIIMFSLYVVFFPQLIAGPIVKYVDIEKQIQKRKESIDKFTDGLRDFIIGLSLKVILADNLYVIVNQISNYYTIDIYSFILCVLAFSLEIYYDFYGYSRMAIGLGKMFGFDLPINFNYPYISLSIEEFWKRWHITLSNWFKDYVYIPLGGNRVGKFRWIINMIVVWLLTGFWHGASINFIIWGLYYFILLILEKLFLREKIKKWPKLIRWIYSFVLINIGWAIFILSDFNSLVFIKTSFVDFIRNNYNLINYVPYIIISYIFMFPIFNKVKVNWLIKDLFIFTLFFISILFLISNSYHPFLYFRF